MFKKVLLEGKAAQKKFLEGIEAVDTLVGGTIGPAGKNRIIQRKYKAPLVINDGATIARHIVLDDPIEDMAAQTIIEIAMKTAEQAGDGTTTAVVIATKLATDCMKKLMEEKGDAFSGGAGVHAMALWKEIRAEKDKAIFFLKESAKALKAKDLDNVIATSLENLEYGKTLGDLMRTVGAHGYVSVEDNWATKYGITTELTTGMRFLGSYASSYLVTSKSEKEAVWEDTQILVCNHRIESSSIFTELVKELNAKGIKKLVIIGGYSEGPSPFSPIFIEGISRNLEALASPNISANVKDKIFQVLAVKAPSLTSPELDDVATFCGATFLDKNLGIDLASVRSEHLGFAKKVSVTEDEVNILGGKGNTEERIETLKKQLDLEKDQMFKEKLKKRIASLSSGVGIIRVGASTESERSYLKYKLEDAVNAAKAALEEGIVEGGGIALKKVAEKLGEKSILYKALLAPYERIQENAGHTLLITSSIVDPLKVVRLALENACSGAGALITTDGAIAEEKLDFMDYFEKVAKKLIPRDERDDWRDSENQDLGAGRLVD